MSMSYKEHNMGTAIQNRVIIYIVTMFVIVFVYQTGLMVDADALTRYYNCTTRVANKNGTLSLQNIENYYDHVFKGAEQAEKDEASQKHQIHYLNPYNIGKHDHVDGCSIYL